MTERDDRTEAVEALLAQTEQAHGEFETAQLGGVYDRDWPRWYAAYAVEHGLSELVDHVVTTDQLAPFLAGTLGDFQEAEREPGEPWTAYTARRITTEL